MRIACALLLLATPMPMLVQAQQWDLSARPALLKNSSGYTPAVRFTVAGDGRQQVLQGKPWERSWSLDLDAPLTWNASDNPESLRLLADYGWDKSLKRIQEDLTVDDDDGPINWGYLRLQAGLELEAPQTFDAGLATANALLAYEHDERRIWFVPSLRAALGAVACQRCEAGDAAAFFGKADMTLGWNVPVRQFVLRARSRAFITMGEPESVGAEVESDGLGGSVELAYRTRSNRLREIFVRWASGKMPVRLEQTRAWSAGLRVGL